MRKFKFSLLYSRAWREQFGEEFDQLVEDCRPGFRGWIDILWNASLDRFREQAWVLAWIGACFVIGFLNIVAKEVQWPAGVLSFTCLVGTFRRPGQWLRISLASAAIVPISSLWTFQLPGKHPPLYESAIAIFPAMFGSMCALIILRLSYGLVLDSKK